MSRKKLISTEKRNINEEYVYECINGNCNYRYIGKERLDRCPDCKRLNTFARCSNYIITV